MKWIRIDESNVIIGKGTIQFDDDIVAVYKPNGEREYIGTYEDCPYKDDESTYSSLTKTYRVENPEDEEDYRIIALV